jgi:hypothetical protein
MLQMRTMGIVAVRPPCYLGLAIFVAACSFTGGYEEGYQCGENDLCPSGQSCVSGVCVSSAGDDDAPPDADPNDPDGGGTGRCSASSLLRDDFADGAVGEQWFAWTSGGTATVAESGGVLTVTFASGSTAYGGYSSAHAYDLTGSSIEVTVPQTGGRYTILEAKQGGVNAQVLVEAGQLYAAILNTADEDRLAQIAYDPAIHKRWRLREAGGQLYWEWSTDGDTWSELHHQAVPFDPRYVYASLVAGEYATANQARFDDFNLPPPAGGDAYCPASTLVDDFAEIGPQWESWDDPPGCTLSTLAASLHMVFDGSTNKWCGVAGVHLYDISESEVVVDAGGVIDSSGLTTFLQLTAPKNDSTHLLIGLDSGELAIEQAINGTNVSELYGPYDATQMRYWRIRGTGGRVYFETSPDGTADSWTMRLDDNAQIDLTHLRIAVGAGRYASGSPVVTNIGSINL